MSLPTNKFETIVIGGGHAGIEAAAAASKKKCHTLLLTQNIHALGQMACNPSIGGIGKGHLVKEIDAMGGLMPQAADQSGIQFKILNTSKGYAVRATRAQIDKNLYKEYIQKTLHKLKYLTIMEGTVYNLIIKNEQVIGIKVISTLSTEEQIFAKTVILTTGTFLNGKIYIGINQCTQEKIGNITLTNTLSLSKQLQEIGCNIRRFKTGTSPRITKNSVCFSMLTPQYSDSPLPFFSFMNTKVVKYLPQVPCYITHTNDKTHELIYNNLHLSPIYMKKVTGVGPRYCPSIEDKVLRFPDRNSHQIFLEYEGLSSSEIYLNGISTSLPLNVQVKVIRSILGLEKAVIVKPGFVIEYDFLDPMHLQLTLESKLIKGLFFAGQINGTTGYEEAAAQGLLAGINAAQFVKGDSSWFPRRDQAYLGVLVDDLCTQGVDEPYRMFTSRSEYRLLLREDNADIRLTRIARQLSLIDDIRWQYFCLKEKNIANEYQKLKNMSVSLSNNHIKQLNLLFSNLSLSQKSKINVVELLRKPGICYQKLVDCGIISSSVISDHQIILAIEIQIKYEGYINRQQNEILRYIQNENLFLPKINFDVIPGLSKEVIDKLNVYKPVTLGQASRISGVTPAAVSILLIWLKKHSFVLNNHIVKKLN